ncbi:NAD(P)/FAD-dependent oxidoreductase [Actinokineospora fastidiosa]|uniref:NAD(P)/FAD-dependent oxidoreductase n=1 Tax=Actinokineospora fastidiosa TaxID=1816 RepID=UPI001670123A|nr:hypothetical protein [Actinokineospora fastidiosa]
MSRPGGVAVVAGASMAGLMTAAALQPWYRRVVVFDRDALPGTPRARRCVGQGRHAHGLLTTSVDVLEELLPGITEEFVAKGARRDDLAADVAWVSNGHHLATAPSDLRGLAVSRVLLEHHVRARVAALPGVEIHPEHIVTGIDVTDGAVRRVRVASSGPDQWVDADLVVDATGRASRLPDWLAQAGYPRPREEQLRVDLYYVSRVYTRDPARIDSILIGPTADAPRAGALLWLEGDRWIASLAGYGVRPPFGEAEYLDYAASLPSPLIAETVAGAEVLDGPHIFHIPANLWRRYDEATAWPAGLLPLGDSISVLNPLYGQGITLAAIQARLLRDLLADRRDDLASRYLPRCAEPVANAWAIATAGDAALTDPSFQPGPDDERVARFFEAAATDPDLTQLFLEVINLKQPYSRLTDPQTLPV